MASLRKCKSCGNMVARDAKRCPQCGGKVNKSHGCLLFVILLTLVLIGISIAGGNRKFDPKNNDLEEQHELDKIDRAKSNARFCAQNFLEENIHNIKFIGRASVTHLPADSIPTDLKKLKIDPNDLWFVEQDFTEKNAFGVDLEHSYNAIVEVSEEKGYRLLILLIDDAVVYPHPKNNAR